MIINIVRNASVLGGKFKKYIDSLAYLHVCIYILYVYQESSHLGHDVEVPL